MGVRLYMNFSAFSEYWIKWLLSGMGLMATACVVFFWKKIKTFFIDTINFWKAKDKASYLKEIYGELEKSERETDKKINDLHKELEEFKEHSVGADQQHEEQMQEIMNGITVLTRGVLSSHFNMLLNKSMTYIKRGWISVEELSLYEEELVVYKDLHGNGHLDPWVDKVRKLPNEKPRKKK